MKVIDAHTGLVVRVGQRIPLPVSAMGEMQAGRYPTHIPGPEDSIARFQRDPNNNYYEPLKLTPGIFKAHMVARIVQDGHTWIEKVPLTVRWMHPRLPFQHVAFVPS